MKLIIAGSRTVTDPLTLGIALKESGFDILDVEEVVSGCARGADRLGELWANSLGIHVKHFPADWEKHGRLAGFKRNAEMADYADALLVLWDGQSRGTAHMIVAACNRGLKVFVYRVDDPSKSQSLPDQPKTGE